MAVGTLERSISKLPLTVSVEGQAYLISTPLVDKENGKRIGKEAGEFSGCRINAIGGGGGEGLNPIPGGGAKIAPPVVI